jgi:type II secretion system protein I
MRRHKRLPLLNGMTLIEVLVASVLLGVGVVGLVSVASLAMRNQQRTEQRAAALYLAQEKLAEVELVGPHVWVLGHPTRGIQEREGVTYDWTVQIDQLAVGELFGVLVEVRWSGPGGGGTVELETWLNDYEAVAPLTTEQGEQTAPGAPQFSPPR